MGRSTKLAAIAVVLAASLGLATMQSGAVNASVEQTAEPLRVALYGDSIGDEIAEPLERRLTESLGNVVFDRNTFGGTNACDWFDEAQRDAATFDPDVVLTLFTGNAFTSCMQPVGGDLTLPYIVVRTVFDSNRLASIFPDARVVRLAMARSLDEQRIVDDGGIAPSDLLASLLRGTAFEQFEFLDLQTALSLDGRSVAMVACGADAIDCVEGVTIVRAADGAHLCPVAAVVDEGVLPTCPVYSPGAARVVAAVTNHIVQPTPAWSRVAGRES